MRAARWIVAIALLGAEAGMTGCYSRSARTTPPVHLEVRNRGFFDVVVYGVPSGVDARVRLGTVTGNSEARLTVPQHAVRPGGTLVLFVHAIGSAGSWLSPGVPVGDGTLATLDVLADSDGGLSRSVLYTVPGTSSAGAPQLGLTP